MIRRHLIFLVSVLHSTRGTTGTTHIILQSSEFTLCPLHSQRSADHPAAYTPTTRPCYGIYSGLATGDDDEGNEDYEYEDDEEEYCVSEAEVEKSEDTFDCELPYHSSHHQSLFDLARSSRAPPYDLCVRVNADCRPFCLVSIIFRSSLSILIAYYLLTWRYPLVSLEEEDSTMSETWPSAVPNKLGPGSQAGGSSSMVS